MRILVVSDTHHDFKSLQEAVLEQPEASVVIHLGDGEREFDDVAALFPDKQFYAVAGNCDFASQNPTENILTAAGKRIFYTHGHECGVKYTLDTLIARAREQKADIALYGHTHVPYTSYEDDLYIMNPGSLGHPREGQPTYGIIDLTKSGIVLNVINLR